MANHMKILIFIVAYNAEKTIESVLRRIPESLSQYDTEVLIIDDASRDRTWEKAQEFKRTQDFPFKLNVLVNPVNQGYGGNQKIGFLYAIKNGFDMVALVHGDGQYAPEALPALLKPIIDGQADVVFGSRMMSLFGALKGGMPLYKYVGNRILTAFQNAVLQSGLSEFHTGYRIYSTQALSKVPFEFNTNDFHFDTHIIIQMLLAKQRIKELPIPTFYGDEVCHVNGMKYAWDVAVTTSVARLQSWSLLYRRNFDVTTSNGQCSHYLPKLDYDSSDTRALSAVASNSRVLDIGCNGAHLCESLRKRGCRIVGIGKLRDEGSRALYDEYIEHDLDANAAFPLSLDQFDYALLLDVVEHQRSPEKLISSLSKACFNTTNVQIVVTTGNVAFFITRLMLLLGQFNYGKRGILDMTHTRLFTFNSMRALLETNGFQTLKIEGIPAPYPLAVQSQQLGRTLIDINNSLIKLWKRLFAYQMMFVVKPWASLSYILHETERFTSDRSVALSTQMQNPRDKELAGTTK